MNKVVFTAGVLTVVVVGGLFFCAGLFTGANVDKSTKIVDVKENQEIINKIYDKIPGKPPVKNSKSEDENETQNRPINIDNLLNEIVASHNTADECLLDNVKTQHEDPVTMNQAKRYVVYIGYFSNDISEEISQLMMAKGYPIHIQISHINEEESFVFCGPFKNKRNAEKLMKWLNSHDFPNARLVSHKLLQTDEIDLDLIDEKDDLLKNSDNRKRRTSSKKRKQKTELDEHHDDEQSHEKAEKHEEPEHHEDAEKHEESDHHHEDAENHDESDQNEHNEKDDEGHNEDTEHHDNEENHEDTEHDEDDEHHEDDHVEAP